MSRYGQTERQTDRQTHTHTTTTVNLAAVLRVNEWVKTTYCKF